MSYWWRPHEKRKCNKPRGPGRYGYHDVYTFNALYFQVQTLLVVGDNISCNIEMDMMQCDCHLYLKQSLTFIDTITLFHVC